MNPITPHHPMIRYSDHDPPSPPPPHDNTATLLHLLAAFAPAALYDLAATHKADRCHLHTAPKEQP